MTKDEFPVSYTHLMQEDSGLAIKKMQVDGGASRNDFLLQFQSDILNTQVIRSTISETTALGAAYLAGLAVGVWKHQDDIRKQFQVASIFEPMMEEENRIAHLNGWKDVYKRQGRACK